MNRLAALSVCLISFGSTAAASNSQLAKAEILIIRHAEKPEQGSGLTAAGWARAKLYVGYFQHLTLRGKAVHLTHIFASSDSDSSSRPRLTVEPLAAALHMKVDTRYKNRAYDELVEDLEQHPYGKEILICWRHGKIPSLLKSLGVKPKQVIKDGKWPSNTYDWLIEVPFDGSGNVKTASVKLVKEHLLPGDSR
ncbi:MAG TPA: hypothetical protein VG944_24705 [Fimbriimonas sp.]|nr:hypothetical protein [Fimbriimonas sp.]